MTAVEQITQPNSASTAQSIADIFSASAAKESGTAESANPFSTTLQNTQAIDGSANTNQPSTLQSLSDIDAVAISNSEDLPAISASFGGELQSAIVKPTATTAQADLLIADTSSAAATPFDIQLDDYQSLSDGLLRPEGIPGLQLVQLTGLELNSLVDDGLVQSLPEGFAQDDLASDDLFLFAASFGIESAQPVRLLPLAQLEAIVLPAGLQAEIAASVQPSILASGSGASAALPEGANLPGTATGQLAASQGTLGALEAVSSDLQKSGASEALNPTLTKTSFDAFAQKAADAALQVKADEKAADGYMVQQNQKAAEQVAKTGLRQQQAQATQGQAPDAPAAQVASQAGAALSTVKAAVTGKDGTEKPANTPPVETARIQNSTPASALPVAAPTAKPAGIPITWTPERLAGTPEGAVPFEAISGGLSGLKGDAGFMGSMGLMGGKPSPSLGGNIAKQVNMQISSAVKNGTTEFNMRLNPSELGSVRVKLAFNDAGGVSARILVERPETLELLQRETRGIERAVEAGGHKIDQGGLSFGLDADDGSSAGKAFAEAAQLDRLKEKIEDNDSEKDASFDDEGPASSDLTDLALLEKILSRVSTDTGLDVRV